MRYTVSYTPRAERELVEAHDYIALDSPANAARWLEEAIDAIEELAYFPRRCVLAPEGGALWPEVRQLVVGGYRVLFAVEERTVRVLHVRHGHRRPARLDELL